MHKITAPTAVGTLLLLASCGVTDTEHQGARTDRGPETPTEQLSPTDPSDNSPTDPQVVFTSTRTLYVVDESASVQCTDPNNLRTDVVRECSSAADVDTRFGLVAFDSGVRTVDFTDDLQPLIDELAQVEYGPASDMQGALVAALSLLETDMASLPPDEQATTRYQVVVIGEGCVSPVCNVGCDDETVAPDSLYGLCNYEGPLPQDEYIDFQGQCPDYNQQPQIEDRVAQILALPAGEVSVHWVQVFDSAEADRTCGPGVSEADAVCEATLDWMAAASSTTFVDYNYGGSLDAICGAAP